MGIYKASWVKPSFVVLTSGHSDAQRWASECPDVKNYKWRLNPVWHRMLLYSCTHMATVGVRVNVTDFAIAPNQKVPQRCWHLQHDAHSWKQRRAFSARLKQSGVLELAARVAAGIYIYTANARHARRPLSVCCDTCNTDVAASGWFKL